MSQLDWIKFNTEQLQGTRKADDNVSLLFLKSKMFLFLVFVWDWVWCICSCFDISMFSLPLILSEPAQNSDTVQKSFKPYFKYFRSQVPNSLGYSAQTLEVMPVDLLYPHVWCRPRGRSFWKLNYCVVECFAVLFPPALQQGQFVANYYNKIHSGKERWF